MAKGSSAADSVLLEILVEDVRRLIQQMRRDGKSWNEISGAAGLPSYVCQVIAGETVRNRPTPDRQSGR